jgi:hypothetical protein
VAIISISDLEPQPSESILNAENLSPEELAMRGGIDTAWTYSTPNFYAPEPPTYTEPAPILPPEPTPPLRKRFVKIADSVRVVYY